MYTFILIVNEPAKPESAASFLSPLSAKITAEDGGRFFVEGPGGMSEGWMAITNEDAIARDYEPEVLEHIYSKLEKPSFYLVESRDYTTAFANGFILNLNESMPALIDNNHWFIGDISKMKSLIASGIDWRYYAPDHDDEAGENGRPD